jgi:hypothetical protein
MNARIARGASAAAILMIGPQLQAFPVSPVTLVGCVQPEAAARTSQVARAKPSTGYVLIETRRAVDTTAAVSDSRPTPAELAPVGTSGETSKYRLSGRTADLHRVSGKTAEVVGTMKGGRLSVISVREIPGICDTP